MVQGSPLVAICVCTAKEHVSDHRHLILTRGSGAPLAAVERTSGLLYLSEIFGERSHGGEETAMPAIGKNQQQHSMG